jgi:hypothetical protein
MKILTLVAAMAAAVLTVPAASATAVAGPGAVSIASFAAGAPAAQSGRWERERRYERRHRRAYYRTVCTRKWRSGHRVRICRKVRYWR